MRRHMACNRTLYLSQDEKQRRTSLLIDLLPSMLSAATTSTKGADLQRDLLTLLASLSV